MIADELEDKRKELQELHHSSLQEKKESFYDKNKKNGSSQEDQYLEAYAQLSKHFSLENEDYIHDAKFIRLIDGLDKKR